MFVEKRGIGMRQLAERVFGSAGTKANFSQTTKLQIIKLQKINRGSQFMRKIFISYRRDDSDEAAGRSFRPARPSIRAGTNLHGRGRHRSRA